MAAASELPEFVGAWEDLLFRLERAWEKCKNDAQKSTGGSSRSWLNTMHRLRKKDSLLRYLKQARNAETHVISHTLDAPLRFSVRDRYGRPFVADAVHISVEGSTLTFDIQSNDIGVDWTGELEPREPRLARFKNRGEWYNPPVEHLGVRLKSLHPVAVATLGLVFYRGATEALQHGQPPPSSPQGAGTHET